MNNKTLEKIFKKVYRFLSLRLRSEKEVRDYLEKKLQKFYSKQELILKVEEIVQRLKNENLINDERFINWWVEQRVLFRPKGVLVLKNELKQKGIAPYLIEKYFENHPIDEYQLAKHLLKRKINYFKNIFPKEKQKERAIAFLLRRGFSYQLCQKLIKELF